MLALLLSACAPEVVQTPACAEFVACVEATDVSRSTSTELCDHACSNGLTFHKARFPGVCAP